MAGQLGLAYSLSTAGSMPIEDVAKANDEGVKTPMQLPVIGAEKESIGQAVRFFQLYMPHDDELAESLLKRAADSGYTACIFTLDTWQLAWRHDDIAQSNYAFYRGVGAELGWSDPVFQKRMKDAGVDPKVSKVNSRHEWR